MWMNLLDSASLSAWNKVTVDIIIHAQPSASGSLIRLLESLKKADFSSSALPRLTIELPHDIDEPSRRYLERFRWPPIPDHATGSLLTLHHRIPQHGLQQKKTRSACSSHFGLQIHSCRTFLYFHRWLNCRLCSSTF